MFSNITKFYSIKHVTNENDKQKFFENKLDLLIVAGWRQIIPKGYFIFCRKENYWISSSSFTQR